MFFITEMKGVKAKFSVPLTISISKREMVCIICTSNGKKCYRGTKKKKTWIRKKKNQTSKF